MSFILYIKMHQCNYSDAIVTCTITRCNKKKKKKKKKKNSKRLAKPSPVPSQLRLRPVVES